MTDTLETVLALIDDCASDLRLLPILADALEDCGESKLARWCQRETNDPIPQPFLQDWAFFARNSGYATPPGPLACAWELAMAERHAQEEDWECEWQEDEYGCSGCDCGDEHNCPCCSGECGPMVCLLIATDDNGERDVLTTLGGICGATDEYKRVVEAELALEAMNANR